MKIDKCKWFGHKWRQAYIKGTFNGKIIKFIACFCDRCGYGKDEAYDINDVAKNRIFGTFHQKYFDEK